MKRAQVRWLRFERRGQRVKDERGERKKRLLSQISSFEMRPMTEHFCRRTGRPAPYFMTSATSNAWVCVCVAFAENKRGSKTTADQCATMSLSLLPLFYSPSHLNLVLSPLFSRILLLVLFSSLRPSLKPWPPLGCVSFDDGNSFLHATT